MLATVAFIGCSADDTREAQNDAPATEVTGTAPTLSGNSSPDESNVNAGTGDGTEIFVGDTTDPSIAEVVGTDDTLPPPVTADTAPVPASEQFVVSGTGVDEIPFGTPAAEVLSKLTQRHGPPASDSGWLPHESPCDGLGTLERHIEWTGIVITLSNGPTDYAAAGVEHFRAFTTNDAFNVNTAVLTDGKPILDATAAELQARFPGTVIEPNEIAGPQYRLPDGLVGELTGLTPESTAQTFRAGILCFD